MKSATNGLRAPCQILTLFSMFTAWNVLFFFLLFSGVALGANTFHLSQGRLPPLFFHWTNSAALEEPWRLSLLRRVGELPLPAMHQHHGVVESFPTLDKRPGLFVWTHPITGMASGPNETYGDLVLMMNTMSSSATILELHTEKNSAPVQSVPVDLDSVDAIHHLRYNAANEILWEEWIITHPKAIRYFTVDRAEIRPLLEPQRQRLLRNETFAQAELHFKVAGRGQWDPARPLFNSRVDVAQTVLPVLKAYYRRRDGEFPPAWRARVSPTSLEEGFISRCIRLWNGVVRL